MNDCFNQILAKFSLRATCRKSRLCHIDYVNYRHFVKFVHRVTCIIHSILCRGHVLDLKFPCKATFTLNPLGCHNLFSCFANETCVTIALLHFGVISLINRWCWYDSKLGIDFHLAAFKELIARSGRSGISTMAIIIVHQNLSSINEMKKDN